MIVQRFERNNTEIWITSSGELKKNCTWKLKKIVMPKSWLVVNAPLVSLLTKNTNNAKSEVRSDPWSVICNITIHGRQYYFQFGLFQFLVLLKLMINNKLHNQYVAEPAMNYLK
jgi:hypothetical protein